MKWPTIKDVAEELRLININVECEGEEGCDVRLQVYEDGAWVVRSGDSQYDQDGHGSWGCSSVPGVVGGVVQRVNTRDIASDLINQAKEDYSQTH